jgi:amine acid ABC transporter, permease protein, 3-TM region, His/Glu/Gln/Arg/opine family
MDISRLLIQLLEGTKTSLLIFVLTLIFAIPMGLFIALLRMKKLKIINIPIRIYLLIVRGTPLLLQLLFIYFAPYYLLGLSYDRFVAAILAFVLNYAAYFAEIYRGGIESIPKGQYEAAAMLGFTKIQTFMRIILPQVVKRILPVMGNEFMTLVKDTALAQTLAVAELFRIASNSASRAFSTLPLVFAGIIYLILNCVVEWSFNHAEKRLDYYK